MLSHVTARRDQRTAEEAQERQLETNGGTGESDTDRAKRIALANIKATTGAGTRISIAMRPARSRSARMTRPASTSLLWTA
jgi:hypothetical protein